jgi:uncharacterized protein YutE (UPF0331/DUF86 family)
VPVRPDVVRGKLLDLAETIGHRRSWLPVPVDRLAGEVMLRWAIEHGLHIAAEAVFDTGNHILAGEFQEAPDEYRDIAPRLAARGVITADTARRLESPAGFRNVLVHDYAGGDCRRLHADLGRLDDFEAFVADVDRWLERRGS